MLENQVKAIYTDGIYNINLINGMIRIGIGTLVPNEENQEEPLYKEEYKLIMPLNSFLTSFNSQKKIIDQLVEKNILTKQPEQDTSAVIPEVIK